jgi:hypothetical protein
VLLTESVVGEFTVSDLVCGWDDVRMLLKTTDPDRVWELASSWLPQRLTAALVAAVTVLRPDEAMAAEQRPAGADVAATGHRSPVSDAGQMAGHVAAAERPR